MAAEEDLELQRIRERKAEALKKELENAGKVNDLPSEPITMTDQNFRGLVSLHSKIVVDLWAPWCGPCRMVSPIIEDLAREYKGKVVFGKLNIDENQHIAHTFKVMSIPTLLFIKDMELVEKVTGALPKPLLKQKIEKNLMS